MNSTVATLYRYLLKYQWQAEVVSYSQNTYLIIISLVLNSGYHESLQVVLKPQ